jgi:hypothetical protein
MTRNESQGRRKEQMDEETRKLFEEELRRWEPITKPLVDAVEDSERLSDQDYAIRINTRG